MFNAVAFHLRDGDCSSGFIARLDSIGLQVVSIGIYFTVLDMTVHVKKILIAPNQ